MVSIIVEEVLINNVPSEIESNIHREFDISLKQYLKILNDFLVNDVLMNRGVKTTDQ